MRSFTLITLRKVPYNVTQNARPHLNDPLIQRLIENLRREGFESIINYNEDDEYLTLTIQRSDDPKIRVIKIY